ncbi:MAG: hypothetical protein M3O50_00615 [Myxococcota bacterium]|nr:hypothetical protein [Myxococcota bacterium]
MKTIVRCSAAASVVLAARGAAASPRPLPFSYPYETAAAGETELELYGDMTPLRVAADGVNRLWEPAYQLQNEIEYGLSDRVELGFYQVLTASPVDGGSNAMTFDGCKWRVRARLAEAGDWPVDVALYLELETLHDETALEEKVIVARRFGAWHWMTNLWVEQSEHRPFDPQQRSFHFVLNPTMGITYQVAAWFEPGIEYWARGEIGTVGASSVDEINNRVHHFLGPTLHFNLGKLWWSAGVYADLNNTGVPQPAEIYGPLWVRSVLGLNL